MNKLFYLAFSVLNCLNLTLSGWTIHHVDHYIVLGLSITGLTK